MKYPIHDLVGGSPGLAKVIEFIGTAARSKANVLLEGESGTGKELVARAIHNNSDRANRTFIAVNCAALNENVLENELFGHEKESFTGAETQKKGKFELASGGTLFLDEIGEIAPSIQAKLLRAVEYGEVQRIGGGAAPIHADIRLIAATNRNMHSAMASGQFREDLYYRLYVLSLKMPPLRERRTDIPVLIRHFIAMLAPSYGNRVTGISTNAESILCRFSWPGNVRQLLHVIERTMAFAPETIIQAQDLPDLREKPAASPFVGETLDRAMFLMKRQYVENTVNSLKGNLKEAAETLGKHPAGFSRLLDSLGLSHLKKIQRRRFGTT